MAAIRVRTPGAAYRVLVQPGILARAGKELEKLAPGRPWVVITDHIVWKLWGKALGAALAPHRFGLVRLPAGEAQKKLATAERVCGELVRLGADRTSLLIAFGGGVIGDLAGFVAAIYLRGVDYVQLPTTLLAQIDSSVGGKTGVNLRAGKNLLGAFHQPRLVLADPRVLATLPERELRAGLYEAIKCGIIRSPALFDFLERQKRRLLKKDSGALAELVRRCVEIKAWVVGRDEKESGLRRILNFGHTVGHALEAETRYRHFLHGEAVAWGMRAATLVGEARGLLRPADAARIHRLVSGLGPLPALVGMPPARLEARLRADKKTRAGVVHFVLPERIGKVRIVAGVELASVVRALDRLHRELT